MTAAFSVPFRRPPNEWTADRGFAGAVFRLGTDECWGIKHTEGNPKLPFSPKTSRAMLSHLTWALAFASTYLTCVAALDTKCSVPWSRGKAHPSEPYWLEKIKHQGIAAYNPDPAGYKVFRNVKDYGAVGDGVTDDTAAILYGFGSFLYP